jgi:hypothetical protein
VDRGHPIENARVLENVAADIIGHEKPSMTYGLCRWCVAGGEAGGD